METSSVFQHKENGRKVIYKDICKLEDVVTEESVEGGITFTTYTIDKRDCILCEDLDTHNLYAIPIIQFLNYYAPYADMTRQFINTVEKLKTIENEGHTENIHTLYGGEPKADPE